MAVNHLIGRWSVFIMLQLCLHENLCLQYIMFPKYVVQNLMLYNCSCRHFNVASIPGAARWIYSNVPSSTYQEVSVCLTIPDIEGY